MVCVHGCASLFQRAGGQGPDGRYLMDTSDHSDVYDDCVPPQHEMKIMFLKQLMKLMKKMPDLVMKEVMKMMYFLIRLTVTLEAHVNLEVKVIVVTDAGYL